MKWPVRVPPGCSPATAGAVGLTTSRGRASNPWRQCIHTIALCLATGLTCPRCAAPTPNSTKTAPAQTSTPSATAAEPAPSNATTHSPRSERRPLEPVPTVAATPPPPLQLRLDEDKQYLSRPLSAAGVGQYESFREHSRIVVGQSHLRRLALFPDGRAVLALSDADARVRVYELESKKLLGKFSVPGFERFETGPIVPWPDATQERSFVAGTAEGLELLSAESGQRVALLDSRRSSELRWSPDGHLLLARGVGPDGSAQLRVYRRDDKTLTTLGTMRFEDGVRHAALSPDNRLLALSHHGNDDLRVVDLWNGTDLFRVPAPDYAGDVAFSPDGRFVSIGGEGLLVVDLLNPARRAFYSYIYNNIGHVRFAPGGDVVAASSYDGHIRIFRLHSDAKRLRLDLISVLRHQGRANVYDFVFENGGRAIISASGDQTIRRFAPSTTAKRDTNGGPVQFRTLDTWRNLHPELALPWPPPPEAPMKAGHYQPQSLSEDPRPCRLKPGTYACKVTDIYRLRECTVKRTPRGHTVLDVHSGNLLAVRGVVYDDGPVVRFEGWLTETSSIVGCEGCERQPILGLLRGGPQQFRGILTFRQYHDPYVAPEPPPPDASIEEANDRFPIVLQFKKALPSPAPRGPMDPDDLVIIP